MSVADKFGFLSVKCNFDYGDCKISPVDNFQDAFDSMKEYINQDGFIYPPIRYLEELAPINLTAIEKIPNSERPAHLYRLPASHNIEFKRDGFATQEKLRQGLFGFIIHLIGYIYGARLQFYDWWFDGRVPFTKNSGDGSLNY